MSATTWTIAYRKPRANRFVRPTNFAGTWAQAKALAAVFAERYPDLQTYYVTTRESELAGHVVVEDIANVLVDSGRRVRIVEQGEVEADLIARVPSAELAQQRWESGATIADPAPAVEIDKGEAELLARCEDGPRFLDASDDETERAEQLAERGLVVRDATFGTYTLTPVGRSSLDAYRRAERLATALIVSVDGEPARVQVRQWWERHGLDKLTGITAAHILDAREADHEAALAASR